MPIQQVEVGQRVQSEVCESSVTNGTLASHWEAIGRTQLPEEDSDESLTRVDLALTDESGARYEVTALRSAEWLSQHYDPEAGRAWIEFPEIGLRGWAKVKNLSPAEIEPGPGRLVTATFARTASGILEITIGEDQLTVTREHRFYSVDRGAWVPAGRLHVNELVATDDGPMQVASIAQRPGAIPVYNLEIEGTHTYHVGRARVLVHNNGCPGGAAGSLPGMKGMSVPHAEKTLQNSGFTQTKVSNSPGKNQTWQHADGSEVRIHPYGNVNETPFKSANNAHVHKQSPAGDQLNDLGVPSTNPSETHIGIKNPADLPQVRGRPHGAGSQ